MSNIRVEAVKELFSRKPLAVEPPGEKVSDYYGIHTFGLETMKKYLPTEAYENVRKAVDTWGYIDRRSADAVAAAMPRVSGNIALEPLIVSSGVYRLMWDLAKADIAG